MAHHDLLLALTLLLLLSETNAKSTQVKIDKEAHVEKRDNPKAESELIPSNLVQVNGGFSIMKQADSRVGSCSDLRGDTLSEYGALPNTNCKWIMKTNDENQVFKITIEQLDIGTSEDCGKECLRFSDSFGESVDLCGKLTQADHCVYTTLGNQLTTEFLTDDTPALESFKVTLSAVDPGSVLRTCGRLFHRSVLRALVDALWDRGTCGGTLTAPSGSFNTPGYPASYPSYQDCRWTISANWGKRVAMYMERLHVESSDWTCEYDNVAIAGLIGTANDPVNFCGDMYNILVQSEGNQAIITFYSDDSDNRKGFTLRYETFSHGAAVPIFTPYPQLSNPQCGTFPGGSFFSRIYGGREARPNSWPHIVGIFMAGQHFCGGSIITPKWILTAAHCFYPWPSMLGSALMVSAGDHTVSLWDRPQQTVRIARVISHEHFVDRTKENDIALLELAVPLTFNWAVQPICLSSATPVAGSPCMAAGWGNTEGVSKDRLREVGLPIMDSEYCNRLFGYDAVTPRMLCAGFQKGTKDTCQGDSGGPLMCTVGSRWCLAGVTSWGDGCGKPNRPGVYAKVAHYRDWIKRTSRNDIKDANFCH